MMYVKDLIEFLKDKDPNDVLMLKTSKQNDEGMANFLLVNWAELVKDPLAFINQMLALNNQAMQCMMLEPDNLYTEGGWKPMDAETLKLIEAEASQIREWIASGKPSHTPTKH